MLILRSVLWRGRTGSAAQFSGEERPSWVCICVGGCGGEAALQVKGMFFLPEKFPSNWCWYKLTLPLQLTGNFSSVGKLHLLEY